MHSLIPRTFPPPVFDHFQYEIRQGKAWEIWSHAVPSSRHMVDIWRAVPSEESRRPALSVQMLDVRAFARWTINTVRCSQRWGQIDNGWAPPPVCLPCVYLMAPHVTRSPRPSPAVFHTGSDQILAVVTAWERGYLCTCTLAILVFLRYNGIR